MVPPETITHETLLETVGSVPRARRPQDADRMGRSVAKTRVTFFLFHLLFTATWFVGQPDLLGSLLVWFVLQVSVFAGYHRYFSHRSFKTSSWFEFVLALVGCLSFQEGPIWWASEHRHHHKRADTEDDFHSPKDGFWHSHVGWLLRGGNQRDRIDWDLVPDLCRPIPLWFQRHQVAVRALYTASVALALGWTGVLNYVVVPVVLAWHTSLATNSFCHAFGSHPAPCPPHESCAARNNAVVALLNLGEGWHNNHHANPSYAHHGFHRWYELDVVYLILLALEKLGIIWDVKRRSQEQVSTCSAHPSGRSLSASRAKSQQGR